MNEIKLPIKTSWETIKESGLPAVIYGMGNGADMVIDEFDRLGIPVMGVTASDDFVRGQVFRGYTVKKLSELEGDFYLCIAFGTQIPEVISHILNLTKKYRVIVPVVPVCGNEIFNREFSLKNIDLINKAYNLFTGESKRIYSACISFMLTGNLETLFSVTTGKDETFNRILKPGKSETYLDIGAYRGDTVKEFLHYSSGGYNEIIAAEPDIKNFRKLTEACGNLKNFTAVNAAVSDRCGKVYFADKAGRQSSISEKGKEIDCITVDEICRNKNVTYIKADSEGEEAKIMCGARETILRCKPKLNIALYHRSEDIFKLPLLISEICPDYRFEIRRHPYIPCWDMNLYCV